MQKKQYMLGKTKTREEVLRLIQEDDYVYNKFRNFSDSLQQEFLGFCMGNRGLKISYDPFFKYIFNPEIHPERLSELLSLILGKEVEVVEVLPTDSSRVSDKESLLIMDILVRLKTEELANVEIQKIGYDFPAARCSCYSSDLLMRELSRKKRELGKKFSYKSLKKVYTIVLIEKSPHVYWDYPDEYIHIGKTVFNTGLSLEMLQEYILIPLDVFREMNHNKLNKLEAWFYFLSSDLPRDMVRVVEAFPEFKKLYGEIEMLRYNTKELIDMYDFYREALREADANTVRYMIEEQQKEIDENKKVLAEQESQLAEQESQLAEQESQLAEQESQLAEQESQLAEQESQLAEQESQLAEQRKLIEEQKKKFISLVVSKYDKGLTIEAIADLFEEEISVIEKIISANYVK